MKETKENSESKLIIAEVVGETINPDGQRFLKVQWRKVNGEVSLGSTAKPNKKIIGFKYDIPSGENPFKKLFGG